MLDTLAVMDSDTASAEPPRRARLEEVALVPARIDVAALRAQMAEEGKVVCRGLCFSMEGEGTAQPSRTRRSSSAYSITSPPTPRATRTRVAAAFRRRGDALLLTRDDGPGFTSEGLKRAAEPYFRDKTDARDGEHFGLGLYICRTLAERHGGALTVETPPKAAPACAPRSG